MEIARVKVVDWSGLTKEGSKNSQTSLRRDVLEKVPVGRHGSKFRREKALVRGNSICRFLSECTVESFGHLGDLNRWLLEKMKPVVVHSVVKQ